MKFWHFSCWIMHQKFQFHLNAFNVVIFNWSINWCDSIHTHLISYGILGWIELTNWAIHGRCQYFIISCYACYCEQDKRMRLSPHIVRYMPNCICHVFGASRWSPLIAICGMTIKLSKRMNDEHTLSCEQIISMKKFVLFLSRVPYILTILNH